MKLHKILVFVRSSPRTWGCFPRGLRGSSLRTVFPTHVGVFPYMFTIAICLSRLPHARGGVSPHSWQFGHSMLSSPRTWGCFFAFGGLALSAHVFPTHVGVFLKLVSLKAAPTCLPHARGGVSNLSGGVGKQDGSSPRTWGCFPPQGRVA